MRSREISAEVAAGNPTRKAMFYLALEQTSYDDSEHYVKTRCVSVKHFISPCWWLSEPLYLVYMIDHYSNTSS